MRIRVALLAIVIVVLVGLLIASQRRGGPLVVSGFIEADEIRLGSRVGGRVARVHVAEGKRVRKGQPLVELEPFDLHQRLAQAKAEQSARQAELDKLVAGFRAEERAQAKARLEQLSARLEKAEKGPRTQEIAAAQAGLDLAQAQLELAQMQFNRTQTVFERNAATRDALDEAETQLKVANETTRVREQELNLLLEGTREEDKQDVRAQKEEARQAWLLAENGYRPEEIAQARAAVKAADAAARAIGEQIRELTIRAPMAALVEAVELQQGDLVTAGAPVLSLVDPASLWVRAFVPEDRLSLRVGQRVAVSVDSFPGRRFAAHVSFVARQAEFMPGNVQTPEERSKQVFRIKVFLDEGLDVLRPGMAADVWLDSPLANRAGERRKGKGDGIGFVRSPAVSFLLTPHSLGLTWETRRHGDAETRGRGESPLGPRSTVHDTETLRHGDTGTRGRGDRSVN